MTRNTLLPSLVAATALAAGSGCHQEPNAAQQEIDRTRALTGQALLNVNDAWQRAQRLDIRIAETQAQLAGCSSSWEAYPLIQKNLEHLQRYKTAVEQELAHAKSHLPKDFQRVSLPLETALETNARINVAYYPQAQYTTTFPDRPFPTEVVAASAGAVAVLIAGGVLVGRRRRTPVPPTPPEKSPQIVPPPEPPPAVDTQLESALQTTQAELQAQQDIVNEKARVIASLEHDKDLLNSSLETHRKRIEELEAATLKATIPPIVIPLPAENQLEDPFAPVSTPHEEVIITPAQPVTVVEASAIEVPTSTTILPQATLHLPGGIDEDARKQAAIIFDETVDLIPSGKSLHIPLQAKKLCVWRDGTKVLLNIFDNNGEVEVTLKDGLPEAGATEPCLYFGLHKATNETWDDVWIVRTIEKSRDRSFQPHLKDNFLGFMQGISKAVQQG